MAGSPNNKKFFGPRSSSATSFGFFAVMSVLIMIVDHQIQLMEPVRSGISVVSDTAYSTITAPVRMADDVAERFVSKNRLLKENEAMRLQIEKVKILSSRLETLSEENRILRQMLMQKKSLPTESAMFKVRRVLSDGFTQRFQIDGGSEQGLKVGMPVVSEKGLAGQLVHVGLISSQVQLIQDKNQEVPVLFEGSGVRGLIRGTGASNLLQSRDLPFTDKIKQGDKVVTSGLDGVYPKGLPVGVVQSAVPGETGTYVEVTVQAHQSIGEQDDVLVLLVDPVVNLPEIDEASTDPQERRRAPR